MAKTLACPSKRKDRSVHVRLAGKHASVVHQVARREVIGAIGDDVKFAEQIEGVLARKPGFELANIQERIDRLQLLGGRIQLLAAHVGGGVDDLPLQIRIVHHVKIDNSNRPHSSRAQVERQRRAQPARADAQHLRRFDLELPFHADFGHDQVPRVAQDFFVAQGCGLRRDLNCAGHKNLYSEFRFRMKTADTD